MHGYSQWYPFFLLSRREIAIGWQELVTEHASGGDNDMVRNGYRSAGCRLTVDETVKTCGAYQLISLTITIRPSDHHYPLPAK